MQHLRRQISSISIADNSRVIHLMRSMQHTQQVTSSESVRVPSILCRLIHLPKDTTMANQMALRKNRTSNITIVWPQHSVADPSHSEHLRNKFHGCRATLNKIPTKFWDILIFIEKIYVLLQHMGQWYDASSAYLMLITGNVTEGLLQFAKYLILRFITYVMFCETYLWFTSHPIGIFTNFWNHWMELNV